MTTEEIAYIAGFFDGEGYVGVIAPKATKNKKRYPRFQASITQLDRGVLDWIASKFGFATGVYTERRAYGRARGPMSRLILRDKRALLLVSTVRPFLIVKAKQVDDALAKFALLKTALA